MPMYYRKDQLLSMTDEEAMALTPAWQSKRTQYLHQQESETASQPVFNEEAFHEDVEQFDANQAEFEEYAQSAEPPEGKVPIFISRIGTDAVPETINGEKRYYQHGSVNGKHFKVECNKPVLVDPAVAGALQPLIDQQQALQ